MKWPKSSREDDFLMLLSMLFLYYHSLKRCVVALPFNVLEPHLLKVAHWFWRRRKCKKVIDRRIDGWTEEGQHIRKAHLRFQLRSDIKKKNASWYHPALIVVSKSECYYQSLIYYLTYFINIIDERNLQYANISLKEASIWKQHWLS